MPRRLTNSTLAPASAAEAPETAKSWTLQAKGVRRRNGDVLAHLPQKNEFADEVELRLSKSNHDIYASLDTKQAPWPLLC